MYLERMTNMEIRYKENNFYFISSRKEEKLETKIARDEFNLFRKDVNI
jgi:hypothetical protein